MEKSNNPYDAALVRLNTYIAEQNMRVSTVREMVLEQVCLLPQPFTADQLAKACQAERISVGTVYNALKLFLSAQILHATNRQRGRAATEYELITGVKNHMQIICQQCGRVSDIHDKAIDRLIQTRKYSNFNLQHYSLFVYGECKHCRRLKKE